MNALSRMSLAKVAAIALAGAVLGFSAPAEARLPDAAGVSGPLSGGVYEGIPIRPQTAASRRNEVEAGLASHCYTVRQTVRDRLGAMTVRRVEVCD